MTCSSSARTASRRWITTFRLINCVIRPASPSSGWRRSACSVSATPCRSTNSRATTWNTRTRPKGSSSPLARLSEVSRSMRTKTALFALVTIAASALPLGAAQAQAKIGVVNVARLLQESPQAQAASQSLEGEFANRKRELQTLERDLKTREEKLTKDGATMAEAERRNQEKTLRDAQRDFARKQNEFMEDLNVRR